jgi:hypothetical protein
MPSLLTSLRLIYDAAPDKMCMMLEDFTRWFYSLTNAIAVPSEAYVDMLSMKGYARGKISVCCGGNGTSFHASSTIVDDRTPSQEPALLQSPV